MTRKHFEALAEALKDTKPDLTATSISELGVWHDTVESIIDVCHLFNPYFDEDQFRVACGKV